MPSFFFQTFGCQMNVADSEDLRRLLISRGFVDNQQVHNADLIVVNTCSVRENAEQKAKARINEFARLKKKGASLWVTGCMAQRLGESLKNEIPGVDVVIGAKKLDSMEEFLNKYFPPVTDQLTGVCDKSEVSEFIAVMRGCNNYCAYCIVPYVRGDEKSIPAQTIEKAIIGRVSEGIKEINLLGQNVNSYNDGGTDFADLLERISCIEGLERIRFTTSHPKDCSEKLIKTIAEIPKLCKHIHLPFQAGSDRILGLMNRKYSSGHYRSVIEMIRSYIPDADITTDIIVGFPSEADEEFKETLKMVEEVRFTTAFMFAYSVREGTRAADMADNIPRGVKLERLKELIELQTGITRKIYEDCIGKELEILVSGRQGKKDKLWMGMDQGFKRVLLACQDAEAGMIFKVRAIKSSGMTLICERINR
ncbi:MAG TPA: tRNA (N6-isopentenyl adenosine(37)-C2)-methylthiotransferase MiaB [Chitinispirillaceae bacterium]|nr:tRNA (N6-isopentenyl adenosine(37)-C2)-methylthiotransferase MiaB [Chitinispirillaceae bacterium]